MIICSYLLYFYYIIRLENYALKNIINFNLIPQKFILRGRKINKKIIKFANILVSSISISLFVLGLILIKIFDLSYIEILKHNLYLIFITAITEAIFIFLFIYEGALFDVYNRINAELSGYKYFRNVVCI